MPALCRLAGIPTFAIGFFNLLIFASSCLIAEPPTKEPPPCSAVAVYKYPNDSCTITIDRNTPGSPLPVQVPARTEVEIKVQNQRMTEILKAVTTTDAISQPDVLGGIVRSLVGPLSLVVVASRSQTLRQDEPPLPRKDPLYLKQEEIKSKLQRIADMINLANARLACLQAYVAFDKVKSTCSQTTMTTEQFESNRNGAYETVASVVEAKDHPFPLQEMDDLDKEVKDRCPTPSKPSTDQESCDKLRGNEKTLDDTLTTLQASQKAIAPALLILQTLKDAAHTILPKLRHQANWQATVKISAQEQIGKTSADVATVVIKWQQTNWSLSTGVVLSALANQNFANSPMFVNGVPVTDSSGKVLTIVTVAKTYPSVVFPLLLVNYRLHNLQADSGRWAFLLSGGVGTNLALKTADFAFGPSLQYGNVFVTPALHLGRQTQLTNGVSVGDKLGSSPPSLPTSNQFKTSFGLGITYRLPLP